MASATTDLWLLS